MKTVLTAIKTNLLSFQTTTLSNVKTFKKGVLPPIPVYPAIAFFPSREILTGYQNAGVHRVDLEIDIEVYTKNLKTQDAVRDALDIINAVKDIAKSKKEWPYNSENTCYDTGIGNETLGEPIPYRNAVIQRAVLPIVCRTKATLPAQLSSATGQQTTSKDLMDTIFSTLSSDANLNAIKTKVKGTIPPVPAFPALAVLEDTERHPRETAGFDLPTRTFSIAIFDKLLDKEPLLDRLLDMTKKVDRKSVV